MKHEIVLSLTKNFEFHAQQTESGVEYWLARDLQHLLGYSEWRNFLRIISKAKTAVKYQEASLRTILLASTKWSTWVRVHSGKLTT